MDTLNNNKRLQEVPTSSLGPTSKGSIQEYWAGIFIFIRTTSLPTSSRIWHHTSIRYSKTYLRKNKWKTIILNYWSQFTQNLSTNLYFNETLLVLNQQGRTVKRWKLYLTINHLLSTTYNSRCNWLQYYPSQVDQNTRIYDANGLLLSNLQYGQISINLLHHVHLMEINPDHNPLYNIYMT